LFSSLVAAGIRHRLSFFVDDVVLLIKPTMEEATAAIELLRLFGTASSLFCNLGKSSVSPIRCEGIDLQPVLAVLGCPVRHFSITGADGWSGGQVAWYKFVKND
jgi:hypothetical protein